MIRTLLALFVLCRIYVPVYSQIYQSSLDVRILYEPIAVNVCESLTVYYELLMTNFSKESISLDQVVIIDTNTKEKLCSFRRENLEQRFHKSGFQEVEASLVLYPGSMGIVYLEYTLSGLPKKGLFHKFSPSVLLSFPLQWI